MKAYATAQQSWPAISLTPAQFFDHLDRLGFRPEALPPHVGSIYLCAACALKVPAACAALDKIYLASIRTRIVQRWQSSDFAEEVLQLTRERLLVGPPPRIASYRGTGPLLAWLRSVTRRLALDVMRAGNAEQRRAAEWAERDAPILPDPEESLRENARRWWAKCIERALHDAVASLAPADRQLLLLYYFRNIGVEHLRQLYQVDRATVFRRIERCQRMIESRARRTLGALLGISQPDELDLVLSTAYCEVRVPALCEIA
jgi:RNA polymerase sigma-70 factor